MNKLIATLIGYALLFLLADFARRQRDLEA